MNKRIRQYVGLLAAVAAYYLIHEGAHLLYAVSIGAFKKVRFVGIGMQIDVYTEQMTQAQLGVFCLLGSVVALFAAYVMVSLIGRIGKHSSRVVKACAYYITVALLFIDPLYLSVLCGFFGGGDMNGISLLLPEVVARILYGVIFAVNGIVFVKIVLPRYKASFAGESA